MSFQLLTDASALKESPAGADGDGNSDSNGGGGRHPRDRLAKDMAPHESPRQIGKALPDTMHFGMKDSLQFRASRFARQTGLPGKPVSSAEVSTGG